MKTARQTAAEALMKVNQGGGYSNLVLDAALEKSGLSPRDKAFCCALFYGVLERRLTLDAVIGRYSRLPMKKLSPAVRELLRIALYQLIYMDGVPQSAAVNESVELSRRLGAGHTAGFLNGVLRSFVRDGAGLEGLLPGREEDPAGFLSLYYSAPRWLVEQWTADYGPTAAEAMLRGAQGRPPLYLRVNTLKTTAGQLAQELEGQGIEAAICREAEGCLEVSSTGEIDRSPSHRAGLFTVQDLSSQLCALALDAQPGMRVADMCAAPGGKSFTIAQLMENRGSLRAFDLHPQKVRLIQEGAGRLGLSCITAQVNDGKAYNPQLGLFQRVLCDVPCSGLGVIRRKPEIRYKPREELAGLPEVQYRILETSARYLEPGGRLVYSTCTLSRAENEQVTERFLREHPEFVPAPLPAGLAERTGAAEPWRVTLLPGRLDCDGFFLASFTRGEAPAQA